MQKLYINLLLYIYKGVTIKNGQLVARLIGCPARVYDSVGYFPLRIKGSMRLAIDTVLSLICQTVPKEVSRR